MSLKYKKVMDSYKAEKMVKLMGGQEGQICDASINAQSP